MSKHIVIFSHGFGVHKDDRGMFTDIAAALPDAECVLFDYNQYDETTNTLTVAALDKQATMLAKKITEAQALHPGAVIDLICHSQGCVVAGLAQPAGVRKIVCITPPAILSVQPMVAIFGGRPGAHFDAQGESSFPRRDGSTTIVPQAYWPSIQKIDPIALYNQLATDASVAIINASHDEVIGEQDFSELHPSITVMTLRGNHDFTGDARAGLLATIGKELT